MVGFGESNEIFGGYGPIYLSCEDRTLLKKGDRYYEDAVDIEDDDEEEEDELGVEEVKSLIIRVQTFGGKELRIQFDDYMMYMNRNEPFSAEETDAVSQGKWLLKFEKSRLLDLGKFFVKGFSPTLLDDAHYGIYADGHFIDVLTRYAPILVWE